MEKLRKDNLTAKDAKYFRRVRKEFSAFLEYNSVPSAVSKDLIAKDAKVFRRVRKEISAFLAYNSAPSAVSKIKRC